MRIDKSTAHQLIVRWAITFAPYRQKWLDMEPVFAGIERYLRQVIERQQGGKTPNKRESKQERHRTMRVYFVQVRSGETLDLEMYLALCYSASEAREILTQSFAEHKRKPPHDVVAWRAFKSNTRLERLQ